MDLSAVGLLPGGGRRWALSSEARSWSNRTPSSRCKSTSIAPSIGWSCAGPLKSPSGPKFKSCMKTNLIILPIGSVHRLANPGKIPLELIEVQVGSYLGEDDIVRLTDEYGRD